MYKRQDCEIPEYTKKNLGISRDALIEAVAETSEEYMERYFSGEEFTQDEIYTAVQTHVCDGSIAVSYTHLSRRSLPDGRSHREELP